MDEKKDLVWTWQMLRQIFWDVQPLGNESLGRDILNITKIIVDGTYRWKKWLVWVYGKFFGTCNL